MIKVILKDRLNPYREESCVYETSDPVKAVRFINGCLKSLLYEHWQIKTELAEGLIYR